MSGKKGKFVVYPRVSAAAQEEGTSLDTQTAACIKLAVLQGYSEDDAIVLREVWTGVTVDRPQLAIARRMSADGEIEAMFVYSTDRLSRDAVDLLVLIREFGACGVDLRFVLEPMDASPEGELVNFVRGFAWRQEHAKIRERSVRAKDAIARDGRWPSGWRNQRFGYDGDAVTRKRVVNEEEAKVVRWIFRKYVDGWSIYRITRYLNDNGIRSKTGVGWWPNVVRSILKNTSYIGVDYYGQNRSVGGDRGKGKQVRAPREQWIEVRGHSPRLVSDSLWLRAQERIGSSQARRSSMGVHNYALTGFVKCGKCGMHSLVGSGHVKSEWYYWCNGAAARHQGKNRKCDVTRVNAKWMEGRVWTAVVSMIQDPGAMIAALTMDVETGGGDLGEEVKRLERELARVEREEQRMLVLYQRGTVRVELLDSQMAELSASREDLQNRLISLEKQRASVETVEEAGERIREYCKKVRSEIDDLDADGKRALMYRLGIRVVAVPGDLLVTAELDSGFVVNEDTSPPNSGAVLG